MSTSIGKLYIPYYDNNKSFVQYTDQLNGAAYGLLRMNNNVIDECPIDQNTGLIRVVDKVPVFYNTTGYGVILASNNNVVQGKLTMTSNYFTTTAAANATKLLACDNSGITIATSLNLPDKPSSGETGYVCYRSANGNIAWKNMASEPRTKCYMNSFTIRDFIRASTPENIKIYRYDWSVVSTGFDTIDPGKYDYTVTFWSIIHFTSNFVNMHSNVCMLMTNGTNNWTSSSYTINDLSDIIVPISPVNNKFVTCTKEMKIALTASTSEGVYTKMSFDIVTVKDSPETDGNYRVDLLRSNDGQFIDEIKGYVKFTQYTKLAGSNVQQ